MVRDGNVPLDADVLVGQHHGGDNSSSACFIEAVTPRFVVFPAGNARHGHPRARAAQRFLDRGVVRANIFRTDRGDDEPGDEEWDVGLEPGCTDRPGDDDVEILLPNRPSTDVRVRYRLPRVPCRP
jgi:competence protein ComEC